jgi:predicted CoA-binding protein
VGASANREKYGNMVLRVFMQDRRPVSPINPSAKEIEGLTTFATLAELAEKPHGISIITPPPITESIIKQAIDLGINNVWLQPGAENERAIAIGTDAGLNMIAGGPCILVVLGFRNVD